MKNDRCKFLSQNFFRNSEPVKSFVSGLDLSNSDTVLEIGAGEGVITRELACRCARVLAIEKDPLLCNKFAQELKDIPNISAICEDFLHYTVPVSPYKVVANIPFSITSAIINKLIYGDNKPTKAYLIVQKEAAERFTGFPRETQYAVLAKPWFSFEVVRHFRRTDFSPVPSVDVVLLVITQRSESLVKPEHEALYRAFVKYGFGAWKRNLEIAYRKIFTNLQFRTLAKNFNFSVDVTPTSLRFEQWLGLFQYLLVGVPEYKWAVLLHRGIDINPPTPQPSGRRSPMGRGARSHEKEKEPGYPDSS